MKTLQQAQEAQQSAAQKINHRYRLGYHIMAPAQWINDPNGLIQYQGEYHAFYQHHPYDENWGPMHWGHVKSKDLVYWEHLPIALTPGNDYDKDGCFSGSAVDDNGRLTLIYTGHIYIDKEQDTFYQTQNIAVSQDGVTFTKVTENAVIPEPPADSAHHFRDPKVWKHEDTWYMILGNATKDMVGRVILYRSADLRQWEYVGVLAQSDGSLGFMWECPDFFELDGKHILLISPQGIEKQGDLYNNLFQTGYLIGDYQYDTNSFTETSPFTELDNGHDFYAAQTFLDDQGRRIVIGWMDMWESDMPTKADGWCGALTLPRVLTLSDDHKLRMHPVEELKALRNAEYQVLQNQTLATNYLVSTNQELLEIKAVFDIRHEQPVSLKLRGIHAEETLLTYDYKTQKLLLDCSKSGKAEDGIRTAMLHADNELILHLFVDRSSIEVFAGNGEATMTSRIYPTEERLGIEVAAGANVKELTYWTLNDIWK